MKGTSTAGAAGLIRPDVARDLLRIEAVTLSPDNPFTWASGLKAPLYCDNRLTMAYPEVRLRLTRGFLTLILEHNLTPEVIVGTATAGIPHAAWLAQALKRPMAYVRSKPKAHGRGNQIEGRIEPGQRVIVVEDLVSTGMSSMGSVEALRAAGAEVLALLAIFTYGLPGVAERFEKADVPFYTLTTFDTLLRVAYEDEHLSEDDFRSLKAWQQEPEAWSEAHSG